MNLKVISTLALMGLGSFASAESYALDQGHTEVRFYWDHAGLTTQSGEWTRVSGTIDFDAADVAATKAVIEIDTTSLHTGFPALDTELKGANFFDVEAHPTATFTSTSAVQTDAGAMRLSGDLVVKGKATPIVLDVQLTFMGEHALSQVFDYYQGEWIGAEATSTMLRTDVGVGGGAPITGDTIRLEISAEMRAGGWPQ